MYKKILIISLKHLGDIVTTLPVAQVLKEAWPAAELHYLVNPAGAPLLAANPSLAKIHISRRHAGLAANWRFFKSIFREKFDLVLDYSENDRGAAWSFFSRAGTRIGYRAAKQSAFLRKLAYTALLPDRAQVFDRHVSVCHAEALSLLGLKAAPLPYPRLYFSDAAGLRAAELMKAHGLGPGDRHALVHLTAHDRIRFWPPERCAEALDYLAAKIGPVFLVSQATPEERDFVNKVLSQTSGRIIDLHGQLDLDTMMALLDGAALFLGLDSLVGHMAAALSRPTVSIFGPASDTHWAPRGPLVKVAALRKPCHPCVVGGCLGDYVSACLKELSFKQYVQPLIDQFLTDRPAEAGPGPN